MFIILYKYKMLEEYKEQIKTFIFNKNFFLVLLLVVIFISLAIYIYKVHVEPKMNSGYVSNKEFVTREELEQRDVQVADLYLFYTTWCPHCKTTKPIWQELKNQVSVSGVNGVKINFIEVDCDKEKDVADKFKIEGYPTIKMIHKDQIIEYDAKPELDTLHQFLSTYL